MTLIHSIGTHCPIDIAGYRILDAKSEHQSHNTYMGGPHGECHTVHCIEYMVFSGGEVHIEHKGRLEMPDVVRARIQNSNDLMALISMYDIYRRCLGSVPEILEILYFPYARQDRYTTDGSSFSLKWFANIINGLGSKFVRSLDPHSAVTPALVNGFREMMLPSDFSYGVNNLVRGHESSVAVISPDAGGFKRAAAMAQRLKVDLSTGIKTRDPSTGQITKTMVYGDPHDTAVIVDDICDGGRTFIELAKVLRTVGGYKNVYLAVTHGIFSKGLDVFDGHIDKIITTTSFATPYMDPTKRNFSNNDRLVYTDVGF